MDITSVDILLAICVARNLTSGDNALLIAWTSAFAAFNMQLSSSLSGSKQLLFSGSEATPSQNILSAQ